MTRILTVGDTNRAGTLRIIGAEWDHNGTMRVTVEDTRGYGEPDMRVMRRLARRTLMYPEKTRSSRVIAVRPGELGPAVTFAVSRLEP